MIGVPTRGLTALLTSVSVLALATASLAQKPQGGIVTNGSATISATALQTTIGQTSDRAIIDWRGFDVGPTHRVQFNQPSAQSATLNRISSGAPTTIAGGLNANGTVIVQNGAGVLFTGTARVDVGSLVATSQAVDPTRFLSTSGLSISGGESATARVSNAGGITVREAGLAALVGSRVENSGTIVARRGTVALASGLTTTIDFAGDGLISIATEGNPARSDARVVHTGRITAEGGRVVLTAGVAAGMVRRAINTTGIIDAANAAGQGGTIELVGRDGAAIRATNLIDASGATGGGVLITGSRIAVAGNARVHARGTSQGGTVDLGGDGVGQPLPTRTRLGRNAEVDVSATAGSAGAARFSGSSSIRIAGTVRALGAPASGTVVMVTQNKVSVRPNARVETAVGGVWQLEGARPLVFAAGSGVRNRPPHLDPSRISAASMNAALENGTNVTLRSATSGGGTERGDAFINAPLTWSGPGSLTITASRDLKVGASVTTSGTGSIALNSTGSDVILRGPRVGPFSVTTASGAITVAAPAGSILVGRDAGSASGATVASQSGAVSLAALNTIRIAGGTVAGAFAQIGRSDAGALVGLNARAVEIVGGSAAGASARVTSGAGGGVSIIATEQITVSNGAATGATAEVLALDGATLTMRAPVQTWDGEVRSSGAAREPTGGTTSLSGAITASVAPVFDLVAGARFDLGAIPGLGYESSFTSTAQPLVVTTRGTGTIDINGPVTAPQVTLISEAQVRLGAAVTGTGPGDTVVVAAGRSLLNAVGTGAVAVTNPDARFLVYIDTFAGLTGAEPGAVRNFDLYGRLFPATPPPSLAGLTGNRIVYGSRPTLVIAGDTLTKTYGDAATPGFVATGLRPGDSLATALASGPTVGSAGAPAAANAGIYSVDVAAAAAAQGYLVVLTPGSLTANPAPLTITANDASRLVTEANPPFTANVTGFRLSDTLGSLGGVLTFATSATTGSPAGAYAITPVGVASGNYAISFVNGTLTVLPVLVVPTPTPSPAPPPSFAVGDLAVASDTRAVVRRFGRGVDPLTPGDATFRTTVTEAPPAVSDPFALTYSLGTVVRTGGGGSGFFPASAAAGGADAAPLPGCGGVINLGRMGCPRDAATEAFWPGFRARATP